jgi:hypothetical protein
VSHAADNAVATFELTNYSLYY